MNDNFETPCRQLFGQPWDIFMKTLTQLCNNFERGVYLCPALWVVYSHSLHQKKTLIDLRLISYLLSPKKLPGTRVFVWVPHHVWQLVTRHRVQWLRQVAGVGASVSAPLIGGSVQPDGIVDQGEQGRGYFVVHQTAAEKAKMFFYCFVDFEIIKALSIKKQPPDVSKIVPCTIDCNDTFWPVAFALAFYRKGLSKIQYATCPLWFMELLQISSHLG